MGAGKKLASSAFVVRNCRGLEELRACVALQKQVWKFSDADLVPLRMFVVAEKIGGQVIGAFIRNQLAGFSLSLPAMRNGKPYAPCGTFVVAGKTRGTSISLNAPYDVQSGDTWVVTKQMPGNHEPGPVVLQPRA